MDCLDEDDELRFSFLFRRQDGVIHWSEFSTSPEVLGGDKITRKDIADLLYAIEKNFAE